MDDRLYSYVSLSTVPKLALRFTNHREERTTRLRDDDGIDFIDLPQPMTRAHAAEWLRSRPESDSHLWQAAIEDELRASR